MTLTIHDLKYTDDGISFMLNKTEAWLHYDVKKYNKYTDNKNYDGALTLAILMAMERNESLIIKGHVSYKLYKNMVNYIMPFMRKIFPSYSTVDIECDGYIYEDDARATYASTSQEYGCSASCGVDSSCCFEDYYFKYDGPDKIILAANFYAGADDTKSLYDFRLDNVRKFIANKTDLDIFLVETNFHVVNSLEHQKIHVFRNLSIPMFFQGLFKKYYYSSGQSYPDDRLFTTHWNISDLEIKHILSDPIIIPLLSTYTLEFELHGAQYRRYEKINKIAKNPVYNNYLSVCVNECRKDMQYLNCGKCSKCVHTLLMLEYYELLDQYSSVFPMNVYMKYKRRYKTRLADKKPGHHEILELAAMAK